MMWKHYFRLIDASDSLKTYAEEVLGKEARFLLKDSQWQVFYSKNRHRQCQIEVTVKNGNGHFKATSQSGDFYSACDSVAQKLSKQFQKKKEKLQQHKDFTKSKNGRLRRVNSRLEYDSSPFPAKKTA